jgi:hypothetical protein
MGLIASRPGFVAPFDIDVSPAGDETPTYVPDFRLGPAGHYLPINGLGISPSQSSLTLIKKPTGALQ